MRKRFSKNWKASSKIRKKRKYIANAPLHIRKKFLNANLAKELRKYGRSLPIREGDLVKIMRGKFKGKKGKISDVKLKKRKAAIEGIQIQKKDGTKINVYFDTSNLQITNLNLDDKKRLKRKKLAKNGEKEQKIKEKERGEKNVSEKK